MEMSVKQVTNPYQMGRLVLDIYVVSWYSASNCKY